MVDDSESSGLAGWDDLYNSRETDRKRGILTKNDREYLLGEKEISGQDERNLRYRMRQRVLQSLLDIELLAMEYDNSELDKIIQDDQLLENRIITATLRLAYRLSRHSLDDVHDDFANLLRLVIFDENTEYEIKDGVPTVTPPEVMVDISVNEREWTIPELVTNMVENKVDKEEYQHLNEKLISEYHVEWMDELLEAEGLIPVQPPGVDKEFEVHPLFAKYIEVAQED